MNLFKEVINMPLFTLIGAGVTLACGIFGFSKLDIQV